jgi:hypothetical protein
MICQPAWTLRQHGGASRLRDERHTGAFALTRWTGAGGDPGALNSSSIIHSEHRVPLTPTMIAVYLLEERCARLFA